MCRRDMFLAMVTPFLLMSSIVTPSLGPLSAAHRHTIATWLRTYRDGGLAAVFERLQERLAPRVRQLSGDPAVAREELGLEVPSNTLHGIVRYQLSSRKPGCRAGLMSLGVDCP